MKQNLGRLTFTLSAVCGIVFSGHAFAKNDETIFEAAKKMPTGFISSQERTAREGGSSGGGGDALYLNSQSGGDAVVVPVPDDLRNSGTIAVNGTPGAMQPKTYNYYWCSTSPEVKPDRKYCQWMKAPLNQPTHVKAGSIHEVLYSNSLLSYSVEFPVKIENGTQLSYDLKKIEVPKVDSTFQFNVYADFSDDRFRKSIENMYQMEGESPRDLAPVVGHTFTTDGNYLRMTLKSDTETETPSGAKLDSLSIFSPSFEQAILSGDILSTPEIVSFVKRAKNYITAPDTLVPYVAGTNGGYFFYFANCFQKDESFLFIKKYVVTHCENPKPEKQDEQFWSITDPSDGEFISVFPGNYGIKFTSQNGQISYVRGIQVK